MLGDLQTRWSDFEGAEPAHFTDLTRMRLGGTLLTKWLICKGGLGSVTNSCDGLETHNGL
jgi:hypothetical protein